MIYLHEPFTGYKEKKYINECFKLNQISSIGNFINKFEKKICKISNARFTVACSSGTAALHVALKVLGVNKGTEVIVPTITFIATVNAIKYNLAEPIFMDNDNFYNIDENKTLDFLQNETYQKNNKCFNKNTKKQIKAIIITHMYGNASNFQKIFKICKVKNIKIVEDSAESLGTIYKQGIFKNKHSGIIGDIGCLSFNGNKIITTGNGGAVITNNKKYEKKIRYLINQSKERSIEYIHNEVGYNYRMTNLSAALGLAQLSRLRLIIKNKKKILEKYLKNLKKNSIFYMNPSPAYARNNHWLFICRIKKIQNINLIKKIIKIFSANNIESRPIWKPCHLQKGFKKCQRFKITNAVTLYRSSLCLPSSFSLEDKDIKKITKILNKLDFNGKA